MRYFGLMMMAAAMLSLTACQTMQNRGTKESVGAVSGAVIGGILGSKVGGGSGQLWATGAGAIIGGLLGSEVGRSLDRADRAYLGQAAERAHTAPVGETISWNNPDSGHYGSITPTREGQSSAGRYCREYQQTIYVDGREQSAYGTACQQPDGSWEIVS